MVSRQLRKCFDLITPGTADAGRQLRSRATIGAKRPTSTNRTHRGCVIRAHPLRELARGDGRALLQCTTNHALHQQAPTTLESPSQGTNYNGTLAAAGHHCLAGSRAMADAVVQAILAATRCGPTLSCRRLMPHK